MSRVHILFYLVYILNMFGSNVTGYNSSLARPTSTAEVVLYTCKPNIDGVVRAIQVVNTTAGTADTYTIHLRKAGVAASTSTQLYGTTTQTAATTSTLKPDAGVQAGDIVSVVMGAGDCVTFATTVEERSTRG